MIIQTKRAKNILDDVEIHQLVKGQTRILLLTDNGCEVGAIIGKAELKELLSAKGDSGGSKTRPEQ